MVTIPSSKGRNTRKNRCLTSDHAASLVQQHRAEEAAHDEEERHPEAVDGGEDDPETGILLTIRDDPERRDERHGGVQDDPQQHGDGPQGVQVGSSGKGRILDGQGRHGCEAPQSFSRFEIMVRSGQKSPIVLLFYFNSTSWGKGCQSSVPEDLTGLLVDLLAGPSAFGGLTKSLGRQASVQEHRRLQPFDRGFQSTRATAGERSSFVTFSPSPAILMTAGCSGQDCSMAVVAGNGLVPIET